jgi:hypothetical protein
VTAAILLSAAAALGSAEPPAVRHVYEFGWCRGWRQCPACDRHHALARDARNALYEGAWRWAAVQAEWRAAYADAEWRYAAWHEAWWATDQNVDPVPRLAALREKIGPVAYRWRRMPPPTPGNWR